MISVVSPFTLSLFSPTHALNKTFRVTASDSRNYLDTTTLSYDRHNSTRNRRHTHVPAGTFLPGLLPMNCEEPIYFLQLAVMLKMLVFAFAFVELCSRLSPPVMPVAASDWSRVSTAKTQRLRLSSNAKDHRPKLTYCGTTFTFTCY